MEFFLLQNEIVGGSEGLFKNSQLGNEGGVVEA